MIHNPSLRGTPVGIQQKNLVVTCNYEARSLGVEKLMSVKLAKQACPALVLILGEDLKKYRDMSERIYHTLQTFSPLVEKLGLDENFIDVSELIANAPFSKDQLAGHIYKNEHESCQCGCKLRLIKGSIIAQNMRDKLKEELGISCCAGIAHNKLLAKLVGATHKPNQQTTLFPVSSLALIESLNSPRNIPGIGSSSFKKLESLEIYTIKNLQSADIGILSRAFGAKMANQIQELSYGIDQRQVKITDKPKSIGAEDGFPTATTIEDIHERMKCLLQRVWTLVEKDGRRPSQVKLTVRKLVDDPGKHSVRESRQTQIDASWLAGVKKLVPLNPIQESKILSILENLFNKITAGATKWQVTLIGISFTGLPTDSPQKNSIQNYFGTSSSSQEPNSSIRNSPTKNSIPKYFETSPLPQEPSSWIRNSPQKNSIQNYFGASSSSQEASSSIRKHFGTDLKEEPAAKRIRYESGRCPEGIDPDVFRQLPADIQDELIAANPKTTGSTSKPKNISQYFRRL